MKKLSLEQHEFDVIREVFAERLLKLRETIVNHSDTLDREHVRDIILNGPKFVEDRQLNCLAIQEVK